MSDRIYCYPDSDVLKNKLNIHDPDRLRNAERKLTMLRLYDLMENPIKGNFDLKHLKDIHRYLFQDIYTWAGEIRTVDIAKSNLFCKVQYIPTQATKLFDQLRAEAYLSGLEKEQFIKRAAYFFSEINALHPFREGNGRVQREFIRELALQQNYVIRFAAIREEEMLQASIDSFVCNYESIELLFQKSLL